MTTGSIITLNGSASSDAEDDDLTYLWSLTDIPNGSAAALDSTTTLSVLFTADLLGTYTASLVVNDGTSDFADPAEGWDWLVGDSVEAIVVSGSLTCTGTINLMGAEGANVSAVGDTITLHGPSNVATDANLVSVSGHLQAEIGGGDRFDAYDNAGGQSFSTGTITINLDTIRKDTGGGVFTLAADEVTINVTGTYIFVYRVSLKVDVDGDGIVGRVWLEKNAVEVDGTRGFTYNRIKGSVGGENTATMFAIVDVTAADVFRVRAARHNGTNSLVTIADGSSLTIFNR